MKMHRILHALLMVTFSMTSALWKKPVSVIAEPSTTIVIGEVQTRGSNGASDEFIEVYNLSGSSVNLSGYTLKYQTCTGSTTYNRHTFPEVVLQAYGHYLSTGSSYDGATTGDGTFGASIADCGKLQLQDALGSAIDTLVYTWEGGTTPENGWGGLEGGFFGYNPHSGTNNTNEDTSMARLPNTLSAAGGHKNGQDTDNNANDFMATEASSPENRSSPNVVTFFDLTATSPFASPAVGLMAAVGLITLRKRK